MLEKLRNTSNLHFIVIGDIMLDRYIYGDINRQSPEAPVPIVDKTLEKDVLGGSANVASNLIALGASVTLLSAAGNDSEGNVLTQLIKRDIKGDHKILKLDRPTTLKTRIISDGKQLLRIDRENDSLFSQKVQEELYNQLERSISQQSIDGVILQDYDKGLFSEKLIQKIIDLANDHNLPTFVDPKKRNFWYFKKCTLFKPNRSEVISASLNSNESIESKIDNCLKKLSSKMVICTMAEDGMFYKSKEESFQIATQKIEAPDVSGAGDTTLAIMSIAYVLGFTYKEILQLGNAAGYLVCQKEGVSVLTIKELTNHLFY